ncbi:MAG: response regulator [Deltaproteobacteria bacterium]|nr:response regulator [Deltaproteobacteria bacterium]
MPRILIAEDNQDLLAILAGRFRALGFEVVDVLNGADALAAAKKQRPDVVLLDVMMPELNGFQVCRRLKEDPALASVPIVLLTAKDTDADKFWGSEVGANLYLTKPIDPAQVVTHVQQLLRG